MPAKRLLRTDKKIPKCASTDCVVEIKTLNSLQISSSDRDFLLVRHFCFAFFERNPYFFFCAVIFFELAIAGYIPLARHNVLSLLKT